MEYFWIIVAAVILVLIFLFYVKAGRKQAGRMSHLMALGVILVVSGIVFSDAGRPVSYSFFGAAILVSIIDIIRNRRNKEHLT